MTGRCEPDLGQCEIVYHLAGSQSGHRVRSSLALHRGSSSDEIILDEKCNNQRMFYPQCYSNCNIGLGNSLDFPKVSKLRHIVHSWPCFPTMSICPGKLGMHSDPSSDGFVLSDTLTVRQSTSLCLGWPGVTPPITVSQCLHQGPSPDGIIQDGKC